MNDRQTIVQQNGVAVPYIMCSHYCTKMAAIHPAVWWLLWAVQTVTAVIRRAAAAAAVTNNPMTNMYAIVMQY